MRLQWPAIAARLPALAAAVALLLLAWTLAYWTWALFAPRPSGRGAVDAPMLMGKVLAERVAGRHLFGQAAEPTQTTGEAASQAPANFELRGVYAHQGGQGGFAIIAVDGKSVPALVGKAFAPGAVLERVLPDHVMIRRGAALEKLALAGALRGPQAAAAQAAQAGGLTVHALGGEQYGLSRSELSALLGDKGRMAEMGRFVPHPQRGIVLQQSPPGGLPEKLGLRPGDVVLKVNGRAMQSSVDAGRIFEYFTTGQRVRVDVQREETTMTKTIQVYP